MFEVFIERCCDQTTKEWSKPKLDDTENVNDASGWLQERGPAYHPMIGVETIHDRWSETPGCIHAGTGIFHTKEVSNEKCQANSNLDQDRKVSNDIIHQNRGCLREQRNELGASQQRA